MQVRIHVNGSRSFLKQNWDTCIPLRLLLCGFWCTSKSGCYCPLQVYCFSYSTVQTFTPYCATAHFFLPVCLHLLLISVWMGSHSSQAKRSVAVMVVPKHSDSNHRLIFGFVWWWLRGCTSKSIEEILQVFHFTALISLFALPFIAVTQIISHIFPLASDNRGR